MINQNNIKKAITTHIEFIDYVEKSYKNDEGNISR